MSVLAAMLLRKMETMYSEPDDIGASLELQRFRDEILDAFEGEIAAKCDRRPDRSQWWAPDGTRFVLRVSIHQPNWRGERAVYFGLNTGEAAQADLIGRILSERLDEIAIPWRVNVAVADCEAVAVARWIGQLAGAKLAGASEFPAPPIPLDAPQDLLGVVTDHPAGHQLKSNAWFSAARREDPYHQ